VERPCAPPGSYPPWVNDSLSSAVAQASKIRFLCSGNMVRSAFAELYARHLGITLPVDSAGTTYRNHGLYPDTRSALLGLGVTTQACDAFRSRHLDDLPPQEHGPHLVFGMTEDHLIHYRARFPAHDGLFLLGDLCDGGRPIADPVMDGLPFKVAFEAVARAVNKLVRVIPCR
jgi:protein-tyrosine-phosphatase